MTPHKKTALLIHGYHTGAVAWEKTIWGAPPGTLGQVPRGALLVHEYDPDLIVFGSGIAAPGGKTEGQYTREYLLRHVDELSRFDAFGQVDIGALRSTLEARSVFLRHASNTLEEFSESAPLLLGRGIERLILVSNKSHTPRALLTALKVMDQGDMPTLEVLAVPSDVEPPTMPVADVVVFEPPHRPDRVNVNISAEIKKILDIPQEKLAAFRDELSSLFSRFL